MSDTFNMQTATDTFNSQNPTSDRYNTSSAKSDRYNSRSADVADIVLKRHP